MPLKPGGGKTVISRNIAELIRTGYPPAQAKAIAYAEARRTTRSKRLKATLIKKKTRKRKK